MKAGSLVELVENINITSNLYFSFVLPVKMVVYTVREVIDEDGPAIRLEEIVNPVVTFDNGTGELCFDVELFRELLPPIANIEEHINENTIEPVLK